MRPNSQSESLRLTGAEGERKKEMEALSYRFQKKNQIGVPRFTHKAYLFFTPYKTCYNTRCFFKKKIVHFWDALKIGFLSEKFD